MRENSTVLKSAVAAILKGNIPDVCFCGKPLDSGLQAALRVIKDGGAAGVRALP